MKNSNPKTIGNKKTYNNDEESIFGIRLLVILLVAGLTFTACSSDNDVTEDTPVTPPTPAPATYTMTVEANKGNNNASARGFRALAENGNITATWTAGDKVTVCKGNETLGTLTAQSSGASTKLTGTLTTAPSENDKLTLKYLSPNYATQDGTLTGNDKSIDKVCDYATSTVTVATVTDDGKVTINGTATFTSQTAFVKFLLKNSSGNPINASKLTITLGEYTDVNKTTTTCTITPAGGATNAIYVALPPLNNEAIRMVATVGNSTYVFMKTGITFGNAKYYEQGVKMKNPTYPIALSNASFTASSTEYVGSIIGTNGNIYATVADAGNKARAAIAYVGSASNCTKCLAIALDDVNNNESTLFKWSEANTNVTTYKNSHSINAQTDKGWRFPSVTDWRYVFQGLGGPSVPNPDTFNPDPGDPSKNEYGDGTVLRKSINTICANTDLGIKGYWSSTKSTTDDTAWEYSFQSSVFYSKNKESEQSSVRYVYAY